MRFFESNFANAMPLPQTLNNLKVNHSDQNQETDADHPDGNEFEWPADRDSDKASRLGIEHWVDDFIVGEAHDEINHHCGPDRGGQRQFAIVAPFESDKQSRQSADAAEQGIEIKQRHVLPGSSDAVFRESQVENGFTEPHASPQRN